jgi:maltose O-acetyltransferase
MLKKFFNFYKLKKKAKKVIFGGMGYFEYPDNIIFKGFAYVGPDAFWSAKGKIIIGNNVIIGPKSILWTYSHNYESDSFIPYGPHTEDIIGDIIIEDNVWIGLGVKILPGVKIGEGAVIGMGTVVTKDIPPLAVVVGNPGEIVKFRNKERYFKLKKSNKLYLLYKIKNKFTLGQ